MTAQTPRTVQSQSKQGAHKWHCPECGALNRTTRRPIRLVCRWCGIGRDLPLREEHAMNYASQTHELKTWPGYFQKIVEGRKNFEARVNDRVFREGDTVVLREWNPDTKTYTGRSMAKLVGYVAHNVDRLPAPEAVREHGISVFALLDCGDGPAKQGEEHA